MPLYIIIVDRTGIAKLKKTMVPHSIGLDDGLLRAGCYLGRATASVLIFYHFSVSAKFAPRLAKVAAKPRRSQD